MNSHFAIVVILLVFMSPIILLSLLLLWLVLVGIWEDRMLILKRISTYVRKSLHWKSRDTV